jgi:hypothetical protein
LSPSGPGFGAPSGSRKCRPPLAASWPMRRPGAFGRLQAAVIRRAHRHGLIGRAPGVAVDATGRERRHVSAPCGRRRANGAGPPQRAWPKLAAVLHTQSHLIFAAVPGIGPSPDAPDFTPATSRPRLHARDFTPAPGETGYDAEPNPRTALAEDAVATRDAPALPAPALQPALAGREWLQPTQAPPRIGPHRAPSRGPEPRTRHAGRHSHPHAARRDGVSLSTEQAEARATSACSV